MKTQGIEVPCDKHGEPIGYLMFGHRSGESWVPDLSSVPQAFWARLKHAVIAARLVDEFKADEDQAKRDRGMYGALNAEQALFVRWVNRLGIEVPAGHYPDQRLWPWTRGWTEDAVDAYLRTPMRRVA